MLAVARWSPTNCWPTEQRLNSTELLAEGYQLVDPQPCQSIPSHLNAGRKSLLSRMCPSHPFHEPPINASTPTTTSGAMIGCRRNPLTHCLKRPPLDDAAAGVVAAGGVAVDGVISGFAATDCGNWGLISASMRFRSVSNRPLFSISSSPSTLRWQPILYSGYAANGRTSKLTWQPGPAYQTSRAFSDPPCESTASLICARDDTQPTRCRC